MKIQRGSGRRTLLVGLLSCAIAMPAIVQGRISEIVIFGDSLSDTGNAFALQKMNNTPPSYSVDPLSSRMTPTPGAATISRMAPLGRRISHDRSGSPRT